LFRFCNELGTRKYISDKMLSMPDDSFYLVLSSLAASAANKHVDWYRAKGLLQSFHGVGALADWMGGDKVSLMDSLHHYHQNASKGLDDFSKSLLINLPGTDLENETFHAGRVTPVVHYCMGGLAMNTEGQVLRQNGKPLSGLFAAGEVTGNLHGDNRLGGNSLLECTVYGRIIGNSTSISHEISRSGLTLKGESDVVVSNGLLLKSSAKQGSATREITITELEQHNTEEDCWVSVNGRVFDLTEFALIHPGGTHNIQRHAGKDGTQVFTAVHGPEVMDRHSMSSLQVGVLAAKESPPSYDL
jgi:cytochrome b involved in lipid metabolism